MQLSTKDTLKQDIEHLSEQQLKQLADFIAVLKFQSKLPQLSPDISQFASLYQEFSQEDQELAEMGMLEYQQSLDKEEQ